MRDDIWAENQVEGRKESPPHFPGQRSASPSPARRKRNGIGKRRWGCELAGEHVSLSLQLSHCVRARQVPHPDRSVWNCFLLFFFF